MCNKEGGFTEDDFVVEFLGEVILYFNISFLLLVLILMYYNINCIYSVLFLRAS